MASAIQMSKLMRQRPMLNPAIRTLYKTPTSSFGTVSRSLRPSILRQSRQVLKGKIPTRGYADKAPSASLSPQPVKKRSIFRTTLRWTWRLMYISAIGGLAWVGYGIFEMRHPPDQLPPDPSKKTLVILGMFAMIGIRLEANNYRYWMGLSLAFEETGY